MFFIAWFLVYNLYIVKLRLLLIFLISSAVIVALALPIYRFIKPYLPFRNYLLGEEKPITYMILLGNDSEARANGGFAGSYAKITLTSDLKSGSFLNLPTNINPDISFQDIYVPNGQLQGYVTPPAPIETSFQHGTWQLANADWEPDFPASAKAIRWFMEKGKETNPDILAIVNLTTIKEIVDQAGPFKVSEYEATISPENLYLFLQGKAEVGFFPGSTQKKDALTAVGKAFVKHLFELPLNKKIAIVRLVYKDLINQNIVVNSTNETFQKLLSQNNFTGQLFSNSYDTYLLVESNLGANKANAYVKRNTTHKIKFIDNSVHHSLTINFVNSSPEANPNPPYHYGGNYIAYLRFYIPENAQDINIDRLGATPSATLKIPSTDRSDARHIYNLTEIGFFHTTLNGQDSSVTISYKLPLPDPKIYSFVVLKQHGFRSSPQDIFLNEKHYKTTLENDFFLP